MKRVPELVDRVGILRPLRIRDFRLLWIGMTVSMIGDGIYVVAVAWQAYEIWNEPSALAAVGLAWSIPQMLLLLFSGVLSDRLDRRRLMIVGDVVRFIAIGAVGLLALADELTLPRLVGIVIVYGAGQAVFGPAFSSIVPTIVPDDLRVQANSLSQFVRPFALALVGPVVGGLLIQWIGLGWAFLADAGSFVFSAAMIVAMRVRAAQRDEGGHASMRADLVEGFRFVRRRPWLWASMVAATVSLLFTWGPWDVLLPYVVKNDLGGSPASLGVVYGAGGVGAVVVALTMGQRGSLPRKPITVLYVSWAFGMLLLAGFGLVTELWQAMVVALVAEGSITLLMVIWVTLLQRLVPSEMLGRVSSLDWLISTAGVPLSFALVGPAASAFGVDQTLIVAGVLGAGLTISFMYVRGARDPERDGSLERLPGIAA
ncbi:MAG TPA: MFS transporter [Actinomycetota bacterium]|nr:MFS transporter [Actinomycetota bacterium]